MISVWKYFSMCTPKFVTCLCIYCTLCCLKTPKHAYMLAVTYPWYHTTHGVINTRTNRFPIPGWDWGVNTKTARNFLSLPQKLEMFLKKKTAQARSFYLFRFYSNLLCGTPIVDGYRTIRPRTIRPKKWKNKIEKT